MAYFNTCPYCGANLDPGESCDCREEAAKMEEFYRGHVKISPRTGQLRFVMKDKEERHEKRVTA